MHEPSAYASLSGVTTWPGMVLSWIAARTRRRSSVQLCRMTSLRPLPVLNSSSSKPSSSSPWRSERRTRSADGSSVAHGTPLEKTVGVADGDGAGVGVSAMTPLAGAGVGVSVMTPLAGAGVGVSVIATAPPGTGVGVSVVDGAVWALPLLVETIRLRPTSNAAQAAIRFQRLAVIQPSGERKPGATRRSVHRNVALRPRVA